MKQKRLNRDGWGFQGFPYFEVRIDSEIFSGIACVIKLLDGENCYWQTPKAGKLCVCGKGMTWMQLIPDHENHVITCMYFPDNEIGKERENYPSFASRKYPISNWYVDIIDGMDRDEDGTLVFIDKYLDVIFTPEGDILVDDRDELDEAYNSGELSKESYLAALSEGEKVLERYTKDIAKTEKWCCDIREIVEKKIK